MEKLSDKELMQIIYNTFIESETTEEFYKKMSEITKKDKKHIKYLLEEYEKNATPEKKQKIEEARERHKNNRVNPNYDKIIAETLKMDYETLKKYILECNGETLSKIKTRFKEKLKRAKEKLERDPNNEMLVQDTMQLGETLNRIIKIANEKIREMEEQKTNAKIEKYTRFLEKITENGGFSEGDYCQKNYKKEKMEYRRLLETINQVKQYLKQHAPNVIKEYQQQIEHNKEEAFKKLEGKIKRMLVSLPEKYDIIDFYLDMQMSLHAFDVMCENHFNKAEEQKISIFITKYNHTTMGDTNRIDRPTTIKGLKIDDEEITEEIEEMLLKFLEEHNIPKEYIFSCYLKYRRGELSEYLGQRQR